MLDEIKNTVGEAFTPEFQQSLKESIERKVQEKCDIALEKVNAEHNSEIIELSEQAEEYADMKAKQTRSKTIKELTEKFKGELHENTESLIAQAEDYAEIRANEVRDETIKELNEEYNNKLNKTKKELNEQFKNELNENTESLIAQAEDYADLCVKESRNELIKDLNKKFKNELNENTESLIAQAEEYADLCVKEIREEFDEIKSNLESEHSDEINEIINSAEEYAELVRQEESQKVNKHIEKLNKLAEEYVNCVCNELVESLNNYAEKVIAEFIEDNKEAMNKCITESDANVVLDMFSALCLKTGIGIDELNEAKRNTEKSKHEENADLKARYNKEVNENIRLRKENDNLIKAGIINEMKEGLTILQSQKFEKIAENIEFTRDKNFINKLKSIKESIQDTPDYKEEKKSDDLNEKYISNDVDDTDNFVMNNGSIISTKNCLFGKDVWNKFL